jgi:hypothetical protein
LRPNSENKTVGSVALSFALRPNSENKTVGFARQQLHFLCGDKENEAKENLALR